MAFYPWPVLMALVSMHGHGVAGTKEEKADNPPSLATDTMM